MELRITAKASLQRCVEHRALVAIGIDGEEAIEPTAAAKLHHGRARLLMEEPAQARFTQRTCVCELRQRCIAVLALQKLRGPLYGWMQAPHWHVACIEKTAPGKQ